MKKGEWTSYKATLTGKGTIRLKFTPGKRFFLDEVKVVGVTTGISPVTTLPSPVTNTWYTLDGRKLSGKPARKGIYIHNGVRVVIK